MVADGVTNFIEVGPGKVLSGLIKKISPNVEVKTYDEIKG
jgi:[acyl-carrier-protein] S-malonyltransferase